MEEGEGGGVGKTSPRLNQVKNKQIFYCYSNKDVESQVDKRPTERDCVFASLVIMTLTFPKDLIVFKKSIVLVP